MAFFTSAAIAGFFGVAEGFLTTATAFALNTAVGIGLSYAISSALAPDTPEQQFGMSGSLAAGGDVPRSFIIGKRATPGSAVYANTWGNEGDTPNAFFTQVISLCDLPTHSDIPTVYVNGEKCSIDSTPHAYMGYPVLEYRKDGVDHLWIKFYDGTQIVADGFLVNYVASTERPYESTRVGFGVAYAIMTAKVNDGLFSGFPEYRFEFATGIPLYDVSKDSSVGGVGTHRWDDPATWGGDGDHLPAVQAYNIIRGMYYNDEWFYGLQKATNYTLPAANWIDNINKCRNTIEGEGGSFEPLYRSGGEIPVSAQCDQTLTALLTACQGRIAPVGGQFFIYLGEPEATATFTITDDDIIDTEEQSFTPFFGLSDTVNGITATYPEPEEAWNSKVAPPLYRTDLEVFAGNRRLLSNIDFTMVPYATQVQRLMKSGLLEAQRARRHTFTLPPKYWSALPGDIIAWTSARNGYVTKLFRIDGVVDKPNCDVVVDITEIDPSDYDWSQATDFKDYVIAPTGPIRPAPQAITGWQVFPATFTSGDKTIPTISISFAGNVADVRAVRVQVRKASDQSLVFDGEIPYGTPDPNDDPRLKAINATFIGETDYEVRGKFIPYSNRFTLWSNETLSGTIITEGPWLAVTTPAGGYAFYPIDTGDIGPTLSGWQQWMANARRELQARLDDLDALINQQALGDAYDRQSLRDQLGATYGTAKAQWTQQIDVVATANTALTVRTEALEATVNNPTTGVAATASALSTFQTYAGNTYATADDLTELQAEFDNDIQANLTIRGTAQASPGGGYARWAVEVRVDASTWSGSVGMYLDVNSTTGERRVVFDTGSFIITDGVTDVTPFVYVGSIAYLNGIKVNFADIQNVQIGTAQIANAAITSSKVEPLEVGRVI